MAEDEGARGSRLRSYEPPEIEIVVPQAGEMDVLAAAEAYLSSSGAHLPDLTDEWVRSHAGTLHVPEGTGARGWLAQLKEQLVRAQHDQALAEKPARCAQALAERLTNPPADEVVEQVRLGLLQSLAAERTHDPKGFEERLKLQKVASAEELAAQLAPQVAAQASALDAWRTRKHRGHRGRASALSAHGTHAGQDTHPAGKARRELSCPSQRCPAQQVRASACRALPMPSCP